MNKKRKKAITIAGLDPSGGAGILADIKSFNSIKVHGLSVITCITAQNTSRVEEIYKVSLDKVEKQIDVLMKDIKPEAAKTGMLYDQEIVSLVAKKIKRYGIKTVVDPVMESTSGDALSSQGFQKNLREELFPYTYILTPNKLEAEKLSNLKISDIDDMKKSCKILYSLGPENIYLKGGHLKDKYSTDIFYDGNEFDIFKLPKIKGKKAHGSGCSLSALIAGYFAKSEKTKIAVKKAKYSLWNMIKTGYRPGRGADVLNHSIKAVNEIPKTFQSLEHFKVWLRLKENMEKLIKILPYKFIPEVGINFGYAIKKAKYNNDICAIDGRIIKTKKKPNICNYLRFGGSDHIAKIILTVMHFDKRIRSAINLKYSEENLEKFQSKNFKILSFERKNEPNYSKSTMEWGTKQVIEEKNQIPDIIYDKGSIGKEPMIRLIGENPKRIVEKIKRVV
ncbi:MAG: bifunctional hydroxymethylpyrimidine kinase/phosphomethylpyrimidine kinase [Candidatus Thermoplasmatota archaeon]